MKTFTLAALSATLFTGCVTSEPVDLAEERSAITLAPRQLRVLTWNAAFMRFTIYAGGVPLVFESFPGDYEHRADTIADGIVTADPDVVVLQEMFAPDARDTMYERLSAHYPYRIVAVGSQLNASEEVLSDAAYTATSTIGVPLDYERMDSGLQIYSRVPFLPLARGIERDYMCNDEACVLAGDSNGVPIDPDDVGFTGYDDCSGIDCFASKGALLVKLDTPGEETYLVATHLQADEGNSDVREAQLAQLAGLLKAQIPSYAYASGSIVVAGDLNVIGGDAEWDHRFEPFLVSGDATMACGHEASCDDARYLTDVWGFETAVEDPGPTHSGGDRLDYLLHADSTDEQCVEYPRIAWEAVSGTEMTSDHLPLLVDLAAGGRWCSPDQEHPMTLRAPKQLHFGDLDCWLDCDQNETFIPSQGTTIAHAGSYQWFWLDQPGTYSIKVDDEHPTLEVEFEVYHASDMSRALLPINELESERKGFTFAMPDPPYYIRTFVADRTVAHLDYTLQVHQHLCREPDDACVLPPNDPFVYPWPSLTDTFGFLLDEIYLRIETGTTRDGRLLPLSRVNPVNHPTNRIVVESEDFDCVGVPGFQRYADPEDPGTTPMWSTLPASNQQDTDDDWDDDGTQDIRWIAPGLPTLIADQKADYFVRVTRPSCPQALTSTVTYETTLTFLAPGNLTCYAQSDDSGVGHDDEIRHDYVFDGPPGSSPPCEGACDHTSFHDEPWGPAQSPMGIPVYGAPALSGWYSVRFFPNLFEAEDDEPDDALDSVWSQYFAAAWSNGLPPLPAEVSWSDGEFRFVDPDGDYDYTLQFAANHTGPTKKGAVWPL